MVRDGLTADGFQVLREVSQNRSVKLRDVAGQLVQRRSAWRVTGSGEAPG
ncbi:MAG: hypothetical protein ACJ740_06430 [Gaiellales bacterium]